MYILAYRKMYELMPYKLTVNLPSERSLPRGGLASLPLCSLQDEYSNKDGLGVGGFPLLVNPLGTSKTPTSSSVMNTEKGIGNAFALLRSLSLLSL